MEYKLSSNLNAFVDCGFESRRANRPRVAQRQEATVLEAVQCRFESYLADYAGSLMGRAGSGRGSKRLPSAGSIPAPQIFIYEAWWNSRHATLKQSCFGVRVQIPPPRLRGKNMTHSLGRIVPTDFEHLDKYPARRALLTTVEVAERTLSLPYRYRAKYDQGAEGACVGFSESWAQSINNNRFYDAQWLYEEAKKIDEWQGEDYDGTSVRAGFDVLRKVGHKRIHDPRHHHVADPSDGILVNRWAYNVDEIRTAVQSGIPVVMGTNWYRALDWPEKRKNEYWIPQTNLGKIRGGHAWCIYAVSDKRQAFKMVNSWGMGYPLTWFPYSVIERLLKEYGEAGIIVDR